MRASGSWPEPRLARGVLPLGLALVLCAPAAFGQVVDASSTTLLRLHPDWRGGDVRTGFGATEWLNLSARGVPLPFAEDVRVQISAWGTAEMLPRPPDQTLGGDVDLAFVQGALFARHLNLTLGRQLITGGAARLLQLDGANVTANIAKGFGVTGFAGVQTRSRFAYPQGDFAFGGRAFWRHSFDTEVGASFIETLDRGALGRQDLGLDGRYAIRPWLILSASGILSLVEKRFADGDFAVHWQLIPTLELFAQARHASPDLYLPRDSIFTVFASTNRDTVGGGAFWQVDPRVSLYGEYQALWVDGGHGNDAQLRVVYKFAHRSSLGFNGHLLFIPVNGYTDLRAFVVHPLTPQVRLSADVDWTVLNQAINGQRHSVTGTASVSYLVGGGWSTMLAGDVGTSPLYVTHYELTARVGYDFTRARGARE